MTAPGWGAPFTLRERIDRGTYFRVGAGLMAFKYFVDAGAIWLVTGHFWSPLDYLSPMAGYGTVTPLMPSWLTVALVIWTLPSSGSASA
jgi:hypothetical protein